MQLQKYPKQFKDDNCIDGRCPVGVDAIKEIGLSPLEKRAIFFSLESMIKRTRKEMERSAREVLTEE